MAETTLTERILSDIKIFEHNTGTEVETDIEITHTVNVTAMSEKYDVSDTDFLRSFIEAVEIRRDEDMTGTPGGIHRPILRMTSLSIVPIKG